MSEYDIPSFAGKEHFLHDCPAVIEQNPFVFMDCSGEKPAASHQHLYIEVSYISAGSGTCRIWNDSCPVSAGDLFVINTAVPHCYIQSRKDCPLSLHCLYFDPQSLFEQKIGDENYLFGLLRKNNFAIHLALKQRPLKAVTKEFDEIGQELSEKSANWREIVKARIFLLMNLLKRDYELYGVNETYQEAAGAPLAAGVLRLIHEHYADPDFSLKQISELLYLSVPTISRNFHLVTGEFFSDYLCTYRMQRAITLLYETDYPNSRIALMCGYNDFPTFYKKFKQVYGITPQTARKRKIAETVLLSEEERKSKDLESVVIRKIYDSLRICSVQSLQNLVSEALGAQVDPMAILNRGLIAGMDALGEQFQKKTVFIPEVVAAAAEVKACLELLKPHLRGFGCEPIGQAVICTVYGDMHDIGKNLVRMMLENVGIVCHDLGVDTEPYAVVKAVKETPADIVCLSVLMTTNMMSLKDTIDALADAGLREQVYVMVGGAPVTEAFAEKIGADCYTVDAAEASRKAREYLRKR